MTSLFVHQAPSEKGADSKGKEFAQRGGNNNLTELHPVSLSIPVIKGANKKR